MVAQSHKDTVGIEFPSLAPNCHSQFSAHRLCHALVVLLEVTALSRISDEFVDSRVVEVADVPVLG